MVLSECDVNSLHPTRSSSKAVNSSGSRGCLKDENSPSPISSSDLKVLPSVQRRLAPTQCLAAKTNISATHHQRVGQLYAESTFSPRHQSPSEFHTQDHGPGYTQGKASIRAVHDSNIATPVTSQAEAPFDSYAHDEHWSTQRVQLVSLSPSSTPSVADIINQQSDILAARPNMPSLDTNLITKKALPKRSMGPIDNSISSVNKSHCLIDTTEKQLRISMDGSKQDWPTLIPRPVKSSKLNLPDFPYSNSAARTQTPQQSTSAGDRLMAGSSDGAVSHSIRRKRPVNPSNGMKGPSDFSFIRAAIPILEEMNCNQTVGNGGSYVHAWQDFSANRSQDGSETPDDFSSTISEHHSLTARQRSLRDRISNGSLVNSRPGSTGKVVGFTDFTRQSNDSTPESRPHSPSPASFSRPRRDAVAHASATSSIQSDGASYGRGQKTASRIPISDSRKAKLVTLKSHAAPESSTSMVKTEPAFGGRRIASPDALKILDQGVKRRQLQRANTNDSSTSAASSSTKILFAEEALSRSPSNTTSPLYEADENSSDDAIDTPSGKPRFPRNDEFYSGDEHSFNHEYNKARVPLPWGMDRLRKKTPPSNSPFTQPLETIPSQAMLPVFQPKTLPKGGDAVTERNQVAGTTPNFSSPHDAYSTKYRPQVQQNAEWNQSMRTSLQDILSKVKQEDDILHQDGHTGLDIETLQHLDRTLGMLEGQGTPPNTQIDKETLHQMFGHLKRGADKTPKEQTWIENAAAADRYLAQGDDTNQESASTQHADDTLYDPVSKSAAATTQNVSTNETKTPPNFAMSKWSDSTPSVKGISPPTMNASTSGSNYSRKTTPTNNTMKHLPKYPPFSSGNQNRSQIMQKSVQTHDSNMPSLPADQGRQTCAPPSSKQLLGGSVRAAREQIHGNAGFARTTLSAESRKAPKKAPKVAPPEDKKTILAFDDQRGRKSILGSPKKGLPRDKSINVRKFLHTKRYILTSL